MDNTVEKMALWNLSSVTYTKVLYQICRTFSSLINRVSCDNLKAKVHMFLAAGESHLSLSGAGKLLSDRAK